MSLMKSSWGLVFQIIVACCLLPTSSALAVEDGILARSFLNKQSAVSQLVLITHHTLLITHDLGLLSTVYCFPRVARDDFVVDRALN